MIKILVLYQYAELQFIQQDNLLLHVMMGAWLFIAM